MKNVIITGATGMIGSLILKQCLDSPEIERITTITRRPVRVSHDKLTEVIHQDFTDWAPIASCFENQDIAFFCLGVYTGAVDRETFRKITVDFTARFAETLKQNSPDASFVFLSGMGADRTQKSRMMFARDKGAAENHLETLQFGQLALFRPGYIYPVTPRKEPNLSYRILRFLYPLYRRLHANGVISSEQLARAMFSAGVNGTEKTVLENRDIRKLADALL